MSTIKIKNRVIGDDCPPVVIAEIGINHGGSLELAIHMADCAIDSGAEIIKHQTHIVEDEMSEDAKLVIPSHTTNSIYEIMESCALNESDEYELMQHIHSRGSIYISTPFSRAAANRLNNFDIPAFKIGSGECNNYPLIRHIAKFGKPIILSTGMNTIGSISKSVEIFRHYNIPFALLHCTNVYPTPPELVRLGALQEIREAFPDAVIGLSDHTTSNYSCLGAVALGASILERHFTDTLERPGPDIVCSMDPESLSDLIEGARVIFQCSGGKKGPVEAEKSTIGFAFASVVAIKDINAGDKLGYDNIWVKRPGGGDFNTSDYEDLIGKKVKLAVREGTQLQHCHVILD